MPGINSHIDTVINIDSHQVKILHNITETNQMLFLSVACCGVKSKSQTWCKSGRACLTDPNNILR